MMNRLTPLLASLFLIACGDAGTFDTTGSGGTTNGAGGNATTGGTSVGGSTASAGSGSGGDPLDFPNDDMSDEDATVDDALDPTITAPTQLTDDATTIDGITSDDRIVYRTSDAVWSIKAADGAPPRKAASTPGTVHVRGRTVFNYSNLDYDTGVGDLTFWTPAIGRRSVGKAALGDDRVASRHDDAYVMFALDVKEETSDIVIASADTTEAAILVNDASRGGEDTCGTNFGFAGDDAVVTWCEPGSFSATLARFSLDSQGKWQREDIASEAQGVWSSDATGSKLFYVTAGGEGRVIDGSDEIVVGSGVSSGFLHPDGNLLFFTVGDQLRRTDLVGSPVPVVTDGFGQAVDWNGDFSQVVYSDELVYEGGTQQDLFATPTDWFNPSPTTLVDQPVATVGRSAVTDSGSHAMFLTDPMDSGATLHVEPTNGGAGVTFPNVDTVLASSGGLILFTDNRTPNTSPTLADLKLYDASSTASPTLVEAGIVDGRNIQLRSDLAVIAYLRDGEGSEGGLWLRPIE